MTEDQLLSAVVTAHSQKFPLKRGQLFHVPNERNHALQAIQARAKGIFKGVADLLFFENKFNEIGDLSGKLAGVILLGVELKVVGSRHDRHTVEGQVEWGETLERNGGSWRLCTNVEDALSCLEGELKGLTTADVSKMLLEQKGTKIKF